MPPRRSTPVGIGKKVGRSEVEKISATIIISAVVASVLTAIYAKRAEIPAHLSNHPVRVIPDLIPKDTAQALMGLFKDFGEFTSNVDQSKAQGFKPKYEDIGAYQDINADGTCSHKFLFPNPEKNKCVLPQRVDIGKHFILTGGFDGTKELYHHLVDRVSSFGKYTFIEDIEMYPPVKALFESRNFQDAARSVCPKDKQFLDPFQFNFIVQVPGQTVAMHIDSPYFWGASRFSFPQWFLVAMVFSNLFRDKFIDQVQVVGYLHSWDPTMNPQKLQGGNFVWYNNETSWQSVLPMPRSGSVVDGSKMLHASTIYRPDVKAPHMDKSKDNVLKFMGGDRWEVQSNGLTMQNYTTDDLRVTIVYRAKCFKDATELEAYKEFESTNTMDLDAILEKLTTDMIDKGVLRKEDRTKMTRLELAFKIVETYIRYPLPPFQIARVPFNYCALPAVLPSFILPIVEPLFKVFCE